MASSKSFIKANSQTDMTSKNKLSKVESLKGSFNDPLTEDTFGPLSNVRFAVFALGSSAYPNFCAFGQYVDNLLGELGGERLLKISCGDEMCGQEQAFKKWAHQVFKVSCETFCLDDDDALLEAAIALASDSLAASTVRFTVCEPESLDKSLAKCHNRKVTACRLLNRTNLHGKNSTRSTLLLEIESNLSYMPGDHLGVFPANRPEIVDKILQRLKGIDDIDQPIILQIMKENHTSNGIVKTWEPHDRLPACSVKELFTRFLDVTTPPSPNLLQYFASIATNEDDRRRLTLLTTESTAYEDWRHWRFPNLWEVLEEFPSVEPYAPLLVAQLSILQPRFYSISSSPSLHRNMIHLTVAVVIYKTQDGDGPVHYGVCSNYLLNVPLKNNVYIFVRSAPNFHLPGDSTKPIVMVGPGTGIAPFRSFWQERLVQVTIKRNAGRMWLFFGCRQKELDLYRNEKDEMLKRGVLERVFLALSREPTLKKTYVQDLALAEASEIYKIVVIEKGHFYVCGDVTMAENVYHTLKTIVQTRGNLDDAEAEKYMLVLRDENRYHEDIFGITLRTAEVHNKSRESARIRMASEP